MIEKRYIDVARQRGCYLVTGDAGRAGRGTIVLVASMLVRAKSYLTTMRGLAPRGWRVIALEMPGCGQASRLRRAWRFEQYADWLAAFLDAAALDGPPIV